MARKKSTAKSKAPTKSKERPNIDAFQWYGESFVQEYTGATSEEIANAVKSEDLVARTYPDGTKGYRGHSIQVWNESRA